MKKILIIACLACICQAAFSQDEDDDDKKKIEDMFGVSVGANFARIVGENEHNDWRWGLQTGICLRLVDTRRYDLEACLLYSMLGTNFTGNADYTLSYLTLPLLFNYMLVGHLFLGAGLQPGFLLAAKYHYLSQTQDIKDDLKHFDLGIPVQLRYDVTKHFSASLGFTPSVTHLFDQGTSNAHNVAGSIRGIYRF